VKKNDNTPIIPGGVDEYIAACPKEVQANLEKVRAAIQEVAPGSLETTSYFQFPGYSYPGYNYNGMFVWFSFKAPFIRLHVRPPVIDDHKKQLANFQKTKSIVSFPSDQKLPAELIKDLVKASLDVMKSAR
jgi:uncharacterized protein YdhG (YjbR/CyaY superfamily)